MSTVINGDGEITVGGTSSSQGTVKLYEDTDNGTNYVGLQAPASIASNLTLTLPSADGTSGQFLQTDGSGALSFATVASGLTLGTPVATTSGTTVEVTGIPSGIKQLIITVDQMSFASGGSIEPIMEVGTSSTYLTSGYVGRRGILRGSTVAPVALSAYISLADADYMNYIDTLSGMITMTLLDSSTNRWVGTSSLTLNGSNTGILFTTFTFALSGALSKFKIYDALGTDTFDGGNLNIAYA